MSEKAKKKTKLEIAQRNVQQAINETNLKIDELGEHTSELYSNLETIQNLFDKIRNIPRDKKIEYEKLKDIRLNWKIEATKIEEDFKKTVSKNAGRGVAGIGAGVAIVTLGPTAAMGIATTFGVASTGTAIASLSGAAATNAALAWLGGGALAVGGGGMTAGNALLLMAGPLGWSIAAVAMISSFIFIGKAKNNEHRLEDIFTLISKRDRDSYKLAIVELNERIKRIKNENKKINSAIDDIKNFGTDYGEMPENLQYALGAYVNLMSSTTKLLVNPILGLQAKYNEKDLEDYLSSQGMSESFSKKDEKELMTAIANLIYAIPLDEKDLKLLWKSLKKNKSFLKVFEIENGELDFSYVTLAHNAVIYKSGKIFNSIGNDCSVI